MSSTIVPFVVQGTGTGVAQDIVVPKSPHAFSTDAYPAFGGKDEAPSPLFYLLGSLSSCNQVTARIETEASPEDFARLEQETARRCPVSQMFIRSGLDFRSTWVQEPVTVPVG